MNRPVGWRPALLTGLVVLTVTYVVLRLVASRGGGMPVNSWWALVVLAMVAGLLIGAGLRIRTYLAGRAQRPLDPDFARRTVVAAQAATLGGAALTGWYLAQAGVHARQLDYARSRDALVLTVLLGLGSLGLGVVGRLVQSWCRIDGESGDERPGDGQAGTAQTTQLPSK